MNCNQISPGMLYLIPKIRARHLSLHQFPGGVITSGMAIYDTMQHIKLRVQFVSAWLPLWVLSQSSQQGEMSGATPLADYDPPFWWQEASDRYRDLRLGKFCGSAPAELNLCRKMVKFMRRLR